MTTEPTTTTDERLIAADREFRAQLNALANENQHLKSDLDTAADTIMQRDARIKELEEEVESLAAMLNERNEYE